MNGDIFTTRPPAVGYAAAGVQPPAPLYIGPHEALIVDTWSSTAPAALAIMARVLTPGGQVHTSRWSHTPNTDRTRATTYHPLEEGFLLSVTVDATAAAYRRGHCWCQVGLQVGEGATGVPHAQLIADYVTGAARLAWPGGQLHSSVEGPGLIRSITGADPAAGAEISQTVPTGARWRLSSLWARLTTSVTAANRYARLLVDDGSNWLWLSDPAAAHVASTTISYVAGQGAPRLDNVYATRSWAFPVNVLLGAGYRIQTATANLDAGDDWEAPQLLVEEWLEP